MGRINVNGEINVPWNRAHFGAWCIVSSPLILGLDVTQTSAVASIIDVITNPEALAVNQAWAGHPGGLVWSGLGGALGFPAARVCASNNAALKQKGWSMHQVSTANASQLVAPGGGCLRVQGGGFPGGAGGTVIVDCNTTDGAQLFQVVPQNHGENYGLPELGGLSPSPSSSALQLRNGGHCVDVHSGGPIVWMYGCTGSPNDLFTLNTQNKTLSVAVGVDGLCVGVEAADPAGATFASTLQAWAKPLKNGHGVAVLLINPDTKPHDFAVPLYTLPLDGNGFNLTTAALSVRDIWARADVADMPAGTKAITKTVGPMDSVFLRLSKK